MLHALGYEEIYKTTNPKHVLDHLTLGESTTIPSQRVNGISLPNLDFLNPRYRFVTVVKLI